MEAIYFAFFVIVIGSIVWSAQLKKSDPERWQRLREQADARNRAMLKTGATLAGKAVIKMLKK